MKQKKWVWNDGKPTQVTIESWEDEYGSSHEQCVEFPHWSPDCWLWASNTKRELLKHTEDVLETYLLMARNEVTRYKRELKQLRKTK